MSGTIDERINSATIQWNKGIHIYHNMFFHLQLGLLSVTYITRKSYNLGEDREEC
jgi:hypothetical protein